MIHYLNYEQRKLQEVDRGQSANWINIYPPFEPNELEGFAHKHNIPIDFLTDSLDIDERSRYEREDEAKLVLLNTPVVNEAAKANEAIFITVPIGIIITLDTIITISQADNPIIQRFLDGKIRNSNPADHRKFILQIFEQNTFWFLECLKKLNLKRTLIEQELYNSSRNEELKQLLRIEKSLVFFVNSLSANDLLMMKMKRTDFLKIKGNEEYEDIFEDVIIDNGQALEMSNVYTNILSGTMEAYASIISNNMNNFIHRLTIVTIILMVPTLVASFYGMNLKYLPFQDSRLAFYFLIAFSILLGLSLIWFFRRTQR